MDKQDQIDLSQEAQKQVTQRSGEVRVNMIGACMGGGGGYEGYI